MCQVVPFTLPCCRKVYVEVTRVPSCPNSWPNRKCPPELCIQVRGFEPEIRDTGVCWRCKARSAGVSGTDRESLRPIIDKATLVLGLDELGVSGRRRREEQNGNCWFCGASEGYKTCGAREIDSDENEIKVDVPGKRRRDSVNSKGKELVKKVKGEKGGQQAHMQLFGYAIPNDAPHSQYPYPQVFSQDRQDFDQRLPSDLHHYGRTDFQHMLQTEMPKFSEATSAPCLLSPHCQSVTTHQESSPVSSYAYHIHQDSNVAEDGRHSLSKLEPNSHTSLFGDKGQFSAQAGLWFDRVENDNEDHAKVLAWNHSDEQHSRKFANMYPSLDKTKVSGQSETHTNVQQISQYTHDRDRQDFEAQQYLFNGYPPHPRWNGHSKQQTYDDQSNAQQSSRGYAGQQKMNQVLNDGSQSEPKLQRFPQQSVSSSSLDPNIQPDLDDLPPQCDLPKIDDATLIRLLKKYGGDFEINGRSSREDVKLNQRAVDECDDPSTVDQK